MSARTTNPITSVNQRTVRHGTCKGDDFPDLGLLYVHIFTCAPQGIVKANKSPSYHIFSVNPSPPRPYSGQSLTSTGKLLTLYPIQRNITPIQSTPILISCSRTRTHHSESIPNIPSRQPTQCIQLYKSNLPHRSNRPIAHPTPKPLTHPTPKLKQPTPPQPPSPTPPQPPSPTPVPSPRQPTAPKLQT